MITTTDLINKSANEIKCTDVFVLYSFFLCSDMSLKFYLKLSYNYYVDGIQYLHIKYRNVRK